MRKRVPEILDALPHDDPAARASRRDLGRINSLMGNYRFMAREIRRSVPAGSRVVELGAGDGPLSGHQHALKGCQVCGIDLAPRPKVWPLDWEWRQEDVMTSAAVESADCILVSLFLHHLSTEDLARLGERLTRNARLLILTEPARYGVFHLPAWGMELTGIHPVTRHDMHVSIDAGFRPGELGELLGLDSAWQCHESVDWRGALRMVACRHD
ncbi:MAG: class I SAM-dependent methyltransferase [Candidatus Methylacidiphilales bacterium]